jgi:hypothetical protein
MSFWPKEVIRLFKEDGQGWTAIAPYQASHSSGIAVYKRDDYPIIIYNSLVVYDGGSMFKNYAIRKAYKKWVMNESRRAYEASKGQASRA